MKITQFVITQDPNTFEDDPHLDLQIVWDDGHPQLLLNEGKGFLIKSMKELEELGEKLRDLYREAAK